MESSLTTFLLEHKGATLEKTLITKNLATPFCVGLVLVLATACSTGSTARENSKSTRTTTPNLPAGSSIVDAKPASLTPATAAANTQAASTAADGMGLSVRPDPQAKVEGPADLKVASPNNSTAPSVGGPAENKFITPPLPKDDTKVSFPVAGSDSSANTGESKAHVNAVETHAPAPVAAKAEQSEKTAEHKMPDGTDPKVALGWLKNGNTRFLKGYFRKDGAAKKDVQRLAKGQNPHSVILSCSDSRVPPEVVFDQKLGELFTVRTAGETLSATAIASIEYAIKHLGSRLIVVMGHSNCGAVKAAAATLGGGDAGSENLNQLVADIHPRIRETLRGKSAPSKNFEVEGWANAKGVAQDLSTRSPIIAQAISTGRVKVVSALYHLDAGLVDFE